MVHVSVVRAGAGAGACASTITCVFARRRARAHSCALAMACLCACACAAGREPYGLVALEASLMGIPVVSTAHGGLREANPLRELQMPCALVADVAQRTIHRGAHIDDEIFTGLKGVVPKGSEVLFLKRRR